MSHNIELFIHDSFLDSFAALPKPIQKRARDLLKKFKENPKSPSLNYEKISTFKDQSLRTLRITEKYRAIIQAPEKGNGYHLLWVDNHDEAMDWARNKIFAWNQQTQGFQLFEQPEKTQPAQSKPSSVEPLFHFLADADLMAIGASSELITLIRTFKSPDDLQNAKSNLPVDLFEYLFYLSEGFSLNDILQDIEVGKVKANPMQSSNALKHAFVVTDDQQIDEILNGSFEKWKIFLHPSQRTLAYRDFNGPVKVTGGAGTGKTVCAMHRLKYLTGKSETYDQPLLFSTYTKSLTQYLTQTIKGLGIDESQIEVVNIDKLIYDLANSSKYAIFDSKVGYLTAEQEKELWSKALEKVPSEFDPEFFYMEYNEVVLPQSIDSLEAYLTASRVGRHTRIGRKNKLEIWKVIEQFNQEKHGHYSKLELCNHLSAYFRAQKVKPYSSIICDEVQDFSNPELALLRSLVQEKPNDMFLVGDPYQNIYRRSINFSKSGINVRGRSRKLKINYRTTEEIKQLAMNVVSKVRAEDFDGQQESLKGYLSLMHGTKPTYDLFVTPEQEDKFVLDRLNDLLGKGNVQPSEICVGARTNAGLDEIKRLLNSADIKYLDLSNSKESDLAIRVSTFHNMKGHEFKMVFAKGISESTVPFRHANYVNLDERDKAEYEQQERSLYYVVFSRAIQSVIISGVGDKSRWITGG